MDPSLLKLLEEDEDETMPSEAALEALQAALRRALEGDTSTSQPFDSNTGNHSQLFIVRFKIRAVLSQGIDQTGSVDGRTINFHSQQAPQPQSALQPEQTFPVIEQEPRGFIPGISQQQQNDVLEETNRLPRQQKESQDAEQIAGQGFQITGTQSSQRNATPARESGSESQGLRLERMGNQQTSGGKEVPFGVLMPTLLPQLNKDKAMQLSSLHDKMQRNEITKEAFDRHMRDIVGNEKLKLAYSQPQSQMSSNTFLSPSPSFALQNLPRMPSFTAGIPRFAGPLSIGQLPKTRPHFPANSSYATSPGVSMLTNPSYPSIGNDTQNSREMDRQSYPRLGVLRSQISSSSSSAVNQERDHSSIYGQGLNKQQQQQQLASYSQPDVNTSGSFWKSQPHDSQRRQLTHHQSMGSTLVGGSTQAMDMISGPMFERQNPISDPTRFQGGSLSHISSNPVPCQISASKELQSGPLSSLTDIKQQSVGHGAELQKKSHLYTPQGPSIAQVVQGNAIPATSKDKTLEKQLASFGFTTTTNMMPIDSVSPSLLSQLDYNAPLSSQNPSVASPASVNARTPEKKRDVGQKKPPEAPGPSPPLPSKKQKVSGTFSDQSIDQLNDVTAVSGVNLQEEEERLLSGPKEVFRISGASRLIVHEEEERGILLKTPLQKKLAEIMAKLGLKNISNDAERCLSLSVEERMRGLICNLIRHSKQRADVEKPVHLKLITSDVRQQIIRLNCKVKEEWEKKQVEVEKLQKLDELGAPEGSRVDGNKEKNEGQVKSIKMNKEDDDKMRANAANVAARAAVGGDDILSKWQLMAEQARQKREKEAEKGGLVSPLASGAVRKFGARTISVKDVIAVLEREPQMSKSTLIHRLYERIHSMAAA
ncbi:transcription initiation factor TFIID subunit 4b-like [Herrania umbratica]|uniref:Transcription initiation factor TFIID subunit 4b-like n=1 Tax=Herrania umbratica TaxID=108875 RepID=A0A6J1A1U5_9ROSI|nr:transcription initiation factor TFIID subunit 4b-like [Herrania umbratica]